MCARLIGVLNKTTHGDARFSKMFRRRNEILPFYRILFRAPVKSAKLATFPRGHPSLR